MAAENPEHIEIIILRQGDDKDACNLKAGQAHRFEYDLQPGEEPTVLDVLIRAREEVFHDLAFRYGCRNQKCGLCTLEVNGKPRLACRTKVRDGDRLGPLKGLPVIRDLVVNRQGVSDQLRGKVGGDHHPSPWEPLVPGEAFVSLSGCIACYACLKGCPLQEMNLGAFHQSRDCETPGKNAVYAYGNPYTFLRLRRIVEDNERDPEIRDKILSTALSFGLETCRECLGCRCQMGIPLIREVIDPLLKDVEKQPEATKSDRQKAESSKTLPR